MSGDVTRELVRMMDKRATGQGATVGTSAGSIPPHSHPEYAKPAEVVSSLKKTAGTPLKGDVELVAGSNVTLSQNDAAKTITITSSSTRGISFYLDGDLAVEANVMSFIVPLGLTVVEVRLAVDTAPVGADLIIDINKNGVTLFTTQANRPKILAGASSGISVAPDVTALVVGDKITLEIDQVGSTTAGANLAVTIVCTA